MRTMAELEKGETGTVRDISRQCRLRQRFLELGLTPGTHVLCLRESPLGDPLAFLVRGTVYALRRRDAVFVRLSEGAIK